MSVLCNFLNRYLGPFMTGGSMAAIAVVGETPEMVAALATAALFGFMSLPAGGRMLRRAAGVE